MRRFLGAFAVILFGLIGHQLTQEPSATGMTGSSTAVMAQPTDSSGRVTGTTATSVTASITDTLGSGTSLVAHEETRHDPWSGFEISTICLLLAVVLLVAMVVAPRRSLLRWWLQLAPRTQAVPPPHGGTPTAVLVALSISRT